MFKISLKSDRQDVFSKFTFPLRSHKVLEYNKLYLIASSDWLTASSDWLIASSERLIASSDCLIASSEQLTVSLDCLAAYSKHLPHPSKEFEESTGCLIFFRTC